MSKFQMGQISATNMQVGDHNTQNIGPLNQADRDQVLTLIAQLQQQVQHAPLPEDTKKQITEQVVPAMQQAAASPDPKPGLTHGLETLNTNLEKVDTAGKSLTEIVSTTAKIAGIIGTGIHVVAPFLAGFL